MNALGEYLNLGLGALFLNEETYAKMRDDSQRLAKGLVFILIVGAVAAGLAVIGQVLEWSTSPDLSGIKNIVLDEMQKTVWFRAMARDPQAMQSFQQFYDLGWQTAQSTGGANIVGSIANIIINPFALAIRWLIYGVIAFVFARLLGGKGDLTQTLGCTALAAAPEMLQALRLFPYVQLAGLTTWGLLCTYVGIKTSNQLTPWRAFWATLLPIVLLIVLAILFGCICNFALGSTIASMLSGRR